MVHREIQAVHQQVTALIERFPACPAVSSRVTEQFRVGPWLYESHEVTEHSATEAAAQSSSGLDAPRHRARILPAPGHSCGALVVPQVADGRYALVVRYRFAAAKWSLEFPRALSDEDDETWRDTCNRVLDDALGWGARDMTLLGSMRIDPACMARHTIIAVAHGCVPQRVVPWDSNQMIAGSIMVTPHALDLLIRRGDVECAATLSALMLARVHATTSPRSTPNHEVPGSELPVVNGGAVGQVAVTV